MKFIDPLVGRLAESNHRYATFKAAFELMKDHKVKTLVETGTARNGSSNFQGDGGSTILFSHWAMNNNAMLYTVDINQQNLIHAELAAIAFKDHVKFICDDSLNFLKNFQGNIDFLYLDSLDFDGDAPHISQQHHLQEIENGYDKLTEKSIVMIDDCQLPFGGKGKLAIEFLLDKGWRIAAEDYQIILTLS